MSKSRGRKPAPAAGGAGRRLQTVGLFITLLAVAVLVGSMAAGLMARDGGAGPSVEERAKSPSAAPTAAGPTAAAGPPIRIAVLNASGVPRLADRGRARLRANRRFDVKEIGNAPGFGPDSSVVLDRVGNLDLARAVADAMGIARVETRPDANLYLDVTVVLGRDWAAADTADTESAASVP